MRTAFGRLSNQHITPVSIRFLTHTRRFLGHTSLCLAPKSPLKFLLSDDQYLATYAAYQLNTTFLRKHKFDLSKPGEDSQTPLEILTEEYKRRIHSLASSEDNTFTLLHAIVGAVTKEEDRFFHDNITRIQKLTLFDLLINNPGGIDINAQDSEGRTPLSIVVEAAERSYSSREILIKLIEADADINLPDNNGATPLSIASINGDEKVVEILLVAGADKNIKLTETNETPLDAVTRRIEEVGENKEPDIEEIQRPLAIEEMLQRPHNLSVHHANETPFTKFSMEIFKERLEEYTEKKGLGQRSPNLVKYCPDIYKLHENELINKKDRDSKSR